MILHFTDWLSITPSSVLLKWSLKSSLYKESFTKFETSSLPHFSFPCFNVLTDVIISASCAFPSIKSEFRLSFLNDVILKYIYQCIRILRQIWSIFDKRKFVEDSQILPTWNWHVNYDINENSLHFRCSWIIWQEANEIWRIVKYFSWMYLFRKKNFFSTNKIYLGNPHFMLHLLV